MKSIKKIILRTLLGLFFVLVLFIGLFVVPYFANIVMPWDRAGAIETTLLWGGFADLPDNSSDVSVQTSGSMFTRTYKIEFDSNATEIKNWINKSKRLKDLKPSSDENGVMGFEIYPGEEGAIGGTVTVDKERNRVIIRMTWS
jgi:hypothetical protein